MTQWRQRQCAYRFTVYILLVPLIYTIADVYTARGTNVSAGGNH